MIKKVFTLLMLCCATSLPFAQVRDAFQNIEPVTDTSCMKSLNGTWKLKVIDGINEENNVPTLDNTWGEIPVPGCWEVYGFCKPSYDKATPLTGYYRTDFSIPSEWNKERIVLRFDGVLYGYDLWINDSFVGSWRSGYNTALFDITDHVNFKSEKQHLSMRVISQFPGSDFDYNDDWAPNGIFRDVTLFTVPKIHMSNVTILPNVNGEVSVKTDIANADKHTKVNYEIFDANGVFVGKEKVNNPKLWTAETPYLYTLKLTLSHKGKVIQHFDYRFGFRELTIEGNILKLNGQPIKLRGVNCHASDHLTAKVISDKLTLKDMTLMKEASINYIRTSHYPREPRFYELADSLGFYIIDEVPFGFGDKNLYDSTYYATLQQRAQATIRRDKNHTSVLIWSLGNENPLTKICIKLGEYVKAELDSSRPICYPQVGSYFRKFNYDFTSVADLYTPHYPTTDQIGGFYQKADRPVIFTEYCHTLGISLEDHDRQWEIIERTPCIAGGSIWEWNDQGMPFVAPLDDRYGYEERVFTSEKGGFEMFGNKGTDGLLYADRTPLPNYYELQHNYAQAFITDSALTLNDASLTLNIKNRFDFINLKDNVSFIWHLTSDRDTIATGVFSPECAPHNSTAYNLQLPILPNPKTICLLNVEIKNAAGLTFNRQSIRLTDNESSTTLSKRLLASLDKKTEDPMKTLQGNLMIRAGRKATMAELLRVKERRKERYLLRIPDNSNKVEHITTDIQSTQCGNAVRYNITLTPDTTDVFYSELGVAMLLDKKIDRVQWIGNGIMPTYPGRFRAGKYGFWSLHKDDLYFEGNRMGVDAALLTDENGDGLLIFCNNGNISFEQTDKGIVLSYNVAVSGQGPKFARTAFPVEGKTVGSKRGEFYLYNVKKETMPKILKTIFSAPSNVNKPFIPYLTQYDTYLMRFDEIAK